MAMRMAVGGTCPSTQRWGDPGCWHRAGGTFAAPKAKGKHLGHGGMGKERRVRRSPEG